jgi:hypothetical protein
MCLPLTRASGNIHFALPPHPAATSEYRVTCNMGMINRNFQTHIYPVTFCIYLSLLDALFVTLSVCCDFCGSGFLVILCWSGLCWRCLGESCAVRSFTAGLIRYMIFSMISSLFRSNIVQNLDTPVFLSSGLSAGFAE